MKYKCAVCGKEFESGWADEEAQEELAENFPGFSVEECIVVCDDCYQGITNASHY